MKVLVTGAAGQLGQDLMGLLVRRGHEAVGVDAAEMNIVDRDAVLRTVTQTRPDAVIHCAAWTAVDAAEAPENRHLVRQINADGTRHVAEACGALGCKMLYLSTDYVFDGQGETPWEPDCREFAPLNVYGQTKLEGELAVRELVQRHVIVRIAWVFGAYGNNFVRTMLGLGRTHDTLRVVQDQIGTPTYTPDLARLLVDLAEAERYGTYHATNEGGYLSWAAFAEEIFRQAKVLDSSYPDVAVVPVTTAEYGASKAMRPKNSRLSKQKLIENGFAPLPTWQDALIRYLKENKAQWDNSK